MLANTASVASPFMRDTAIIRDDDSSSGFAGSVCSAPGTLIDANCCRLRRYDSSHLVESVQLKGSARISPRSLATGTSVMNVLHTASESQTSMESLFIVIPAYNEQDNIETVIDEWYPVVEAHDADGSSRLVIVDDGSKDDTFPIIRRCAATRPLLLPLRKENEGHGAAVLFAYHRALEMGADYIFQTDSDGQTRPNEFEAFWQQRGQPDMVIGWRKGRQDGMARVFVTKTLQFVLWLCFGCWITDANTPFRLLKAATLKKYISLIPENFNLSNVLLSVIYARKGCVVKYLPITFRPRQGGVNSINRRKIFSIGRRAFVDFIRINRSLFRKIE